MHNTSTSEIPGQRDILCRQTSTCWRMYQVLVWWVSCWLASNQHHTSLADCKSRLLPSKMKQNHISNVKPISFFSWAMIILFLTLVVVHAFRRQKNLFLRCKLLSHEHWNTKWSSFFCESSVMSKLHRPCAVYSIVIVVVIIIHQVECTPDI